MNGPLSAPAAARDDQRASSIINSRGVDCRNSPSFEAEIAGGFDCALKIGEIFPPPTLGERRHRGLACPCVAMRRRPVSRRRSDSVTATALPPVRRRLA
jgi:hypothetical protein